MEERKPIEIARFGRGLTVARALTDRLIEAQARGKFQDGTVVRSELTGATYRLEHVRPNRVATVRRVTPKIRGKAARRAEKRARRGGGLL